MKEKKTPNENWVRARQSGIVRWTQRLAIVFGVNSVSNAGIFISSIFEHIIRNSATGPK